MIFINCSNHAYASWSEKQKKCTEKLGEVTDVMFPNVSPYLDKEEIIKEARHQVDRIMEFKPDYVMCQGEFCMTYAIIEEIKKRNPEIKIVAACSERKVTKLMDDSGSIIKESVFEFVQYREY